MRAACANLLCFAALTAPVAGETRLPATTELVGGVLADDGDLFVVVRGADADEGSYLIRSSAAGSDVFDLPNAWVKSVRALHDGKLLLFSKKRSIVDGHGSLSLDIVTVTADEVVESWGWDSRAECGTGGCEPPVVSGDGSFWGTTGWTEEEPDIVTFAFGRTRPARRKIMRTKVVDLGAPNRNFPRSSFFWFLDSDEDVVMLPWNGGAFIVHFVEGGTPYALPVLQGGAEKDMRWQDGDRVLWIEEAGQWRAYHLWDLGLSGVRDEAFWQLEVKDGWKPHPERGVARVVSGEGGYRVEHLWREPWTTLEERRVSDWYPGQPPRGRLGWDWMVSANGRRAAIVERRSPEEGTVEFHVRHLDLSLEPQPPPPIEAAQADDLIRLPGRVKGGLVDAGGRATLLVEDVKARSARAWLSARTLRSRSWRSPATSPSSTRLRPWWLTWLRSAASFPAGGGGDALPVDRLGRDDLGDGLAVRGVRAGRPRINSTAVLRTGDAASDRSDAVARAPGYLPVAARTLGNPSASQSSSLPPLLTTVSSRLGPEEMSSTPASSSCSRKSM